MNRYQQAVARVVEQLTAGRLLRAYNVLGREDTTVGPYQEAVDRGMRFAVIGWGPGPTEEARTAKQAAQTFVDRVGTTRAREAALKAA